MANLKEVRNRIVSVGSTQQITSAMKMVSAAKLKRAQDAIIQMRPYAIKMREILENLSSSLDSSNGGTFTAQREVKNVLLIVITSNRGLCGGFNANIIKKAAHLILTDYKNCKVNVITIGKKATDFFKKSSTNLVSSHNELFNALNYKNVAPIAEKIMQDFGAGLYDKIDLLYNQFKNAGMQLPTNEQFLPVLPTITEGNVTTRTDYIFEPTKAQIVQDIIPRSLKTQLYKALLDSQASEHGARMTAMHKATDNAKELIRVLKLNYNKARQAAITGEILEIVGGSEALNN
jgi:F-type H+-transporting ATPase subunit gamma